MGQLPYFPPNVSGWEGGLSWLNTDTALARFAFVSALLANTKIADVPGRDAPRAAYARAYAAVGQPWLAAGHRRPRCAASPKRRPSRATRTLESSASSRCAR